MAQKQRTELATYFFSIMLIFGIVTFVFQSHHAPVVEHFNDTMRVKDFLRFGSQWKPSKGHSSSKTNLTLQLAGLSCERFGGPSDEVAAELVYWKDIPSDAQYVSPLKKHNNVKQYLTFEPDSGGWNNIRMSMETMVGLAFAMGRTLVLPPEKQLYLLGQNKDHRGEKQRKHFGFNHFFPMDVIHSEHVGLDIVTMEEFLQQEGLAGKFRSKDGSVAFPPENRTNWDGDPDPIFHWLRKVTHVLVWEPDNCLAAFPATTRREDFQELRLMHEKLQKGTLKELSQWEDHVGRPLPINASAWERLKDGRAERRKLCIYDEQLQAAPSIHIPMDRSLDSRMLVHFYAFLFFQDWKQDLWMKRFVRDHLRYVDEIQCAAARVINAVRKRARERNPQDNPNGEFDSMHVRRGDFQFKVTKVSANEIYEQTRRKLPEGATVYIGTDERQMSYFEPLREHYDVVFLHDFLHELEGINTNYYGMIDQLVTSRGRYFFGCWFSTFTGYINRLRGYHADNGKYPGYEDGIIPSWYYVLADRFDHMQVYYPVKKSIWAREFPTAWRMIDSGIGELYPSTDEFATQ